MKRYKYIVEGVIEDEQELDYWASYYMQEYNLTREDALREASNKSWVFTTRMDAFKFFTSCKRSPNKQFVSVTVTMVSTSNSANNIVLREWYAKEEEK